jgi:hypothetical protein
MWFVSNQSATENHPFYHCAAGIIATSLDYILDELIKFNRKEGEE